MAHGVLSHGLIQKWRYHGPWPKPSSVNRPLFRSRIHQAYHLISVDECIRRQPPTFSFNLPTANEAPDCSANEIPISS
jgi:hypothetical protein